MELPARIDQGYDLPAIVVSPQCPLGESWRPDKLLSLIKAAEQRFRVASVAVTGYSMGGFGAWKLAQTAPSKITAIAPVCGGGDETKAGCLKDVSVWAFHGAKDKLVPPSSSRRMVDAVRQAGGEAKLTIFPEAGHNVTSLVYNDNEIFDWLLTKRKRNLTYRVPSIESLHER
ncbi:carboxylesterase family protein [Botrimarina hoheduenensis]|nr:dienelactone hydrolase family protein [Botrimarina hoheduenensis]